jgi:hypothetical protein
MRGLLVDPLVGFLAGKKSTKATWERIVGRHGWWREREMDGAGDILKERI